MYIIYALYNKTIDKLYIGQTKNIDQRLDLHNNKIFKRSFTARNPGEWKLIYTEKIENRQKALKREKQLKRYRGRQFLKSIIKQ